MLKMSINIRVLNLSTQFKENIMSEAVDIKTGQNKTLKHNQAVITGKIISVRKIKTQEGLLYLSLLRLPAMSEYEHPATIEIRSYEPVGEIDETIIQLVKLGGLPNNYETKTIDRETGEEKRTPVRSARNEFTAII
jgi:hypothetical protein